ncbi:MAG TPA: leucine--tRNA ligase [Candidatus Saccharimonadales bacterium]|nr:leucine--tRNA ligase [Candidatus Saccharimonadales bacterium]
MKRFNPKEIEPKWQKIWDETGAYTTDLRSKKPKYIAMSMFNYPSGAGIHIGHALNYTISDVKARFKRQQGFESYHPIGWDAFGLPAENYAIKSGVSPQESMANIIPGYHKQYKAMGWSNDWEKEIATHLPEYYKWTQWIFSEMFRQGLAYQDSRIQWWCEKDATVLANEQVIDGKCWRHDGPDDPLVEKKEIKQWFFKITEYADELLEATDSLDWTESVKTAQKNWIGKSVGAQVTFQVKGSDETFQVFTTAHDTIYGVTFIVIAPEHELLGKLVSSGQKAEVDAYIMQTQKKSDVERQSSKEKTGVFSGAYAINPLTGKEVPIWVADYVLAGYGTGIVMAVPGEDERDHEFAQKFGLDIVYTTEQQEFTAYADIKAAKNRYKLANSGEFDGLTFAEARPKILEKLVELGVGEAQVNYKMRDWSVSRQRYWGAPIPIIHCPKDGAVLVSDEQLPVVLPELDDFAPSGDGRSALARAKDWLEVDCPQCGGKAERETDTLDTYICSSWYMFRYMDPHNQERIFDSEIVNKWAPIDFYNGGDHATAHLLYARFVARFFTKIGLINGPEPFKQMLFNGKVVAADGTAFSKSKGNGIDPLDIIGQGYGADALRTYLMFASPLELTSRWDPQGVPGTHRFLSRIWNLTQDYLAAQPVELTADQQRAIRRSVHGMIRKMTEDIEGNRYNTAIAAAMACVNELYKLKVEAFGQHDVWYEALASLVACVSPFAPHTGEELWHQLGHSTSVNHDSWPEYNDEYLATDTVTVAVQVNGKLRGTVQVAADAGEDIVVFAARNDGKIAANLEGKQVVKTIYIPGKLLNFVVK